jgi:hypothetical protein
MHLINELNHTNYSKTVKHDSTRINCSVLSRRSLVEFKKLKPQRNLIEFEKLKPPILNLAI